MPDNDMPPAVSLYSILEELAAEVKQIRLRLDRIETLHDLPPAAAIDPVTAPWLSRQLGT